MAQTAEIKIDKFMSRKKEQHPILKDDINKIINELR